MRAHASVLMCAHAAAVAQARLEQKVKLDEEKKEALEAAVKTYEEQQLVTQRKEAETMRTQKEALEEAEMPHQLAVQKVEQLEEALRVTARESKERAHQGVERQSSTSSEVSGLNRSPSCVACPQTSAPPQPTPGISRALRPHPRLMPA